MNSPDKENQTLKISNELPRDPWPSRALNILCAVVVFLFFAGGVREISQIIGHFFPWLGAIASTLAIFIALGSFYWMIHKDIERHRETERQLNLYRREAQRLKDAAGAAIRTDSTTLLIGALKDISIMEGEPE